MMLIEQLPRLFLSKKTVDPPDDPIHIPSFFKQMSDPYLLTLFPRHHRALSPASYLGMTYARTKEKIANWVETTWTVEEPIIETPIYILSSFLRSKRKFEGTERMVEVKKSLTDKIELRMNAWPYRRRQREHYSKIQHAQRAYPRVKANFVATYVTPFVEMANQRIADEQNAFVFRQKITLT